MFFSNSHSAAQLDIRSPLDQFEIRDLINLEILGGNVHFSLTNIGFYLTSLTSSLSSKIKEKPVDYTGFSR